MMAVKTAMTMLLFAAAEEWESTLNAAVQASVAPEVDVAVCGSFMRPGLFILKQQHACPYK